ncbi:uncharacterized protein [Typha angustifolia]|uniref:uncharacterized protein n=1 Tax=Typha angustifolia TaxID=59011 RepID=UPI003C2D5CCD
MGICFGKKETSCGGATPAAASSRDPPPPPEAEETVKEVLSETARLNSTENENAEKVEARRSSRQEGSPAKYQKKRSASVEIANVGCRSGRFSTSPARTIGRTHSARIRRDPGERSSRRYEPAKANGRVSPRRRPAARAGKREDVGVVADRGGKESLENPLVSLECFIFL